VAGAIAQIPEFSRLAVAVLKEVAELEQVERDQVLEAGASVGNEARIPQIGLRRLAQAAHPGRGERPHSEDVVQLISIK
jgi:hypothetical protein